MVHSTVTRLRSLTTGTFSPSACPMYKHQQTRTWTRISKHQVTHSWWLTSKSIKDSFMMMTVSNSIHSMSTAKSSHATCRGKAILTARSAPSKVHSTITPMPSQSISPSSTGTSKTYASAVWTSWVCILRGSSRSAAAVKSQTYQIVTSRILSSLGGIMTGNSKKLRCQIMATILGQWRTVH